MRGSSLGLDYKVGVARGLATAQKSVALVWFAGVAVFVGDLAGNNFVHAGSTVPHAATEGKVDPVGFGEFKDIILGGRPVQFHVGKLKNDFCHLLKQVTS